MEKNIFNKKLSLLVATFLLFTFFNISANSSDCLDEGTKGTTSNVGSLEGDFKVTETGQARYSMPIDVPPGTANIIPALSIIYDSSSSNTRNGMLGTGFSLEGLTAITRCPSNKTQNGSIHGVDFSDQDRFCLAGEQLVAIKGNYGADGTEYRTYTDSKVKVISYGNQGNGPANFKVWTKEGKIAEYGLTTDSQVKAQGKTTVSLWGLNRVQDKSGNYLDIHYFKDEESGSFYPIEINYTGNKKAELLPYNSVKFIYEERPDTKITYQAGSKITTDKRLKAIRAYQSANLVYDYRLTYETSKNTFRSRITNIQKCTSKDICLPSTKFEWQTNEDGWIEDPNFVLPTESLIDGKDDGTRLLDVNGDGLPDILEGGNKKPRKTWLNTGKGWIESKNFILPINIVENDKELGVRILDINGDGLPDVVEGEDKSLHRVWLNTGKDWIHDKNSKLPVDILVDGKDDGVKFLDLTGNGFLDIVKVIPADETKWEGAKNESANKFDFIYTFDQAEKQGKFIRNQRGWTIIYDVEEAAFIYRGSLLNPSRKPYATWINKKDTWIEESRLDVPHSVARIAPYGRGITFLDLDGDGLIDLVSGAAIGENKPPLDTIPSLSTDGDEQRKTWMNLGENNWRESEFILPINMLHNGRYKGLKFTDINGDGLPDIIQRHIDKENNEKKHNVWINTGNSWSENSNFIPPINFAENGQNVGVEILDINGDGLPDIVQNYIGANKKEMHGAWLNTGKRWQKVSEFNLPQNITSGVQYLDLNGDGLPDCIQSTLINGKIKKSAYLNKAKKLPDYLISITDGLGAKLRINYESLSSTETKIYEKENNARYPNIDWQGSMYVVHKISIEAANNADSFSNHTDSHKTSIYNYTGAKLNHLGLGFLGFHTITKTDQNTGISTVNTYRHDTNLHTKGLLVATETKLANGTLISRSRDHWNLKTFSDGRTSATYYSPYIEQNIKEVYDLDGKLISTTTTNFNIDKFGNPLIIVSTVQEAATQKTYTTKTINVYYNSPVKWNLGELLAAKVTKTISIDPEQIKGSGSEVILTKATDGKAATDPIVLSEQKRTTKFAYNPETSLLMETIAEPLDKDMTLNTRYERDVFGNIITTTVSGQDIEERVTKTKYDNYGRFIIQTTNPLNQTAYQTSDPRFGVVTESIDLNGLKTSYQYDDFAQLITQTNPDGTKVDASYTWFNPKSVPKGEISNSLKYCTYVVTKREQNGITQKEYYDILGRKVAGTTQNTDGRLVWQLVYYDSLGRVIKKTQPFFESEEIFYSKLQYDDLDRIVQNILPDGSTSQIIHEGLKTTTINPLKQRLTKQTNALGYLVKSTDNQDSTTAYEYDAYSNMTSVIDSMGNESKIEYDSLGRKTAIYDKDKGHWEYQYDVLGNLTRQTNALNQTTVFKYDKLNRMISRIEHEGTEKASTSIWEYDTASNGIGKLAKVISVVDDRGKPDNLIFIHRARSNGLEAYTRSYSYDSLGRIAQEKTIIGDQSHIKGYSYDQNSRVDIETYPNGLQIKNKYNELGYLIQISDVHTGKVYWNLYATDAVGNIISEGRSNGLITNYKYDTKTQFLTNIDTGLNISLSMQKGLFPSITGVTAAQEPTLKGIMESNDIASIDIGDSQASPMIQQEVYNYDMLGNVKDHYDVVNNMFESYEYDDLNRLTKSNVTGKESQTLRYDALGNITYKSDLGTYLYGANEAGPHAVTSISGKSPATFKYNANGDQIEGILNGKKRSIAYTSYGKPITIKTPEANVEFLYDANHQKIYRRDETSNKIINTYYLGNYEYTITYNGKSITTQQKSYIGPNTIHVKTVDNNDKTKNGTEVYEILRNNLGSTTDITGSNANVLQHFAYTPFGEQIQIKGKILSNSITNKGFTGHEEIKGINLIHMEGRLYDPAIGRFLSADPIVQDPSNGQTLNRYSYCINNPLAFTDPTGFSFFSNLFRSIGNFFESIWDGIKNIGSFIWGGIKAVINSPIGRIAIGVVVGLALGPAGGLIGLGKGTGLFSLGTAMFIGGLTTTAISLATGNNLGQALGEGAIAGTIIGAVGKIAENFKPSRSPTPTATPSSGNSKSSQQESAKKANRAEGQYSNGAGTDAYEKMQNSNNNEDSGNTKIGKMNLKTSYYGPIQIDYYSTKIINKGTSNVEEVVTMNDGYPLSTNYKCEIYNALDLSVGIDGSESVGKFGIFFGKTTDGRYMVDVSMPSKDGVSPGKTIYYDPTNFKYNMKRVGNVLGQSLAKPPPFFPLPGMPGAPPVPVLP